MLPNLSNKWGTTVVEPESVSSRRMSLQKLEKIVTIRVAYTGNDNYAVEISTDSPREEFSDSASSLSTSSSASREYQQTPFIRLERKLFEFKDLRDKVYYAAYDAHYSKHCQFCFDVLDWSSNGTNPDGVFLRFRSGDRVARKLTKYLTDLVACVLQHSAITTRGRCAGQTFIPGIVHNFLFARPPSQATATNSTLVL